MIAGIAGAVKVLQRKANGNGHSIGRQEWHALKDVVNGHGYAIELAKFQMAGMTTTLDRHTGTLDDIRNDLAKIMAAVDRREN